MIPSHPKLMRARDKALWMERQDRKEILVSDIKLLNSDDWHVEGEGKKCLWMIWGFLALKEEWLRILVTRATREGQRAASVNLDVGRVNSLLSMEL